MAGLVNSGIAAATAAPQASAREAYTEYATACQEAGKPCLQYAEWIKAGQPKA